MDIEQEQEYCRNKISSIREIFTKSDIDIKEESIDAFIKFLGYKPKLQEVGMKFKKSGNLCVIWCNGDARFEAEFLGDERVLIIGKDLEESLGKVCSTFAETAVFADSFGALMGV